MRPWITLALCGRRPGTRCLVALITILAVHGASRAQLNPRFNVDLHIDYSSVEETIRLFDDLPVGTGELASLRGNRIAASTTGYIADRDSVTDKLADELDSLKFHQIIRDDIYHLEDGRRNSSAIKELLGEMQRSNFNRKVAATVEQIFPADAEVSLLIPVYVVAIGHENVDAFVRRIVWHGDVPEFVGGSRGELTIVINLSHAVTYAPTLQERYLSLLGVVAHEVFHAAFADYQDRSPVWQEYRRIYQRPFDALTDLTQNEGIAYYLSIDQRGHGLVPRDWYTSARDAFATFNANSRELLSSHLTPERAEALIRSANLSGFHESYGAHCGMFMAREIDLRLGRAALIETVAKGPLDFFKKYDSLAAQDNMLPPFSPVVTAALVNP